MSMATAMEWDCPIPVWIESIAIDMDDEMPVPDLMVDIMGGTPCCPKPHSFLSCSTSVNEQHSMFGTLPDDVNMTLKVKDIAVVQDPQTKDTSNAPPTPVKTKETAKPSRTIRRKVDVDPSGSTQRRKYKQRGYEKNYRSRKKSTREKDEAEMVELEAQIRDLLGKRTADHSITNEFKLSMHERYLELLKEERMLQGDKILINGMLAAEQAMTLWGGQTATSRETRAQLNALPSLRSCLTFQFQW